MIPGPASFSVLRSFSQRRSAGRGCSRRCWHLDPQGRSPNGPHVGARDRYSHSNPRVSLRDACPGAGMVSVCRARWRRLAQVAGHSARVHGPRQGRVACSDGRKNSLAFVSASMAKSANMSYKYKPEWITVTQGALYSGAPARTVRYWAATGRVQARQCGAQWRVERKSLEMYAWRTPDQRHRKEKAVDRWLARGST